MIRSKYTGWVKPRGTVDPAGPYVPFFLRESPTVNPSHPSKAHPNQASHVQGFEVPSWSSVTSVVGARVVVFGVCVSVVVVGVAAECVVVVVVGVVVDVVGVVVVVCVDVVVGGGGGGVVVCGVGVIG